MDYPHPLATLKPDGSIDLSQAYTRGSASGTRWRSSGATRIFPRARTSGRRSANPRRCARARAHLPDRPGREAHRQPASAGAPVGQRDRRGRRSSARDAGPARRARPVRRGGDPRGTPMATIEEVLVPLYFYHRYQVEAAIKVVGGLDTALRCAATGRRPVRAVPAPSSGGRSSRCWRRSRPRRWRCPNGCCNDSAAARGLRRLGSCSGAHGAHIRCGASGGTAADMVVWLLLDEERAARLVQYHARDNAVPGFDDVIDRLVAATWRAPRKAGLAGEVQRGVDQVVLHGLMTLGCVGVGGAASACDRGDEDRGARHVDGGTGKDRNGCIPESASAVRGVARQAVPGRSEAVELDGPAGGAARDADRNGRLRLPAVPRYVIHLSVRALVVRSLW